MNKHPNIAILKSVKGALNESLSAAKSAIEAFTDTNNPLELQASLDAIHQANNTLQMLELDGAVFLSMEAETLNKELRDNTILRRGEALDVLAEALIQLDSYLNRLLDGEPDIPMVLLPVLNDIRTVRNQRLLTEGALFLPDLELDYQPHGALPDSTFPREVMADEIIRLRPIYQGALLACYQKENVEPALKAMRLVIARLIEIAPHNILRKIWWPAIGVTESLLDQSLPFSVTLKLLLGQVDREIKKLPLVDDDAALTSVQSALARNLLYYVASSNSHSKLVNELNRVYQLQDYFPSSEDVSSAEANMKGITPSVANSIRSALLLELADIQTGVDAYLKEPTLQLAPLVAIIEQLEAISDTLDMTGRNDLRQEIMDCAEAVKAATDVGNCPPEDIFMQLAASVLKLKSLLENGSVDTIFAGSDDAGDGKLDYLPESERVHIIRITLEQVMQDLTTIKDLINTIIKGEEAVASDALSEPLDHIKGAFTLLAMTKAASIASACGKFVANHVDAKGRADAPQRVWEQLAMAIACLDFYIESYNAEDNTAHNSVLDVAIKNLAITDSKYETVVTPLPAAQTTSSPTSVTQQIIGQNSDKDLDWKNPELEQLDLEAIDIFMDEAKDVIGVININSGQLAVNPGDKTALSSLLRAYHMLKGSSAMVGAMPLSHINRIGEQITRKLSEQQSVVSRQILDYLFELNKQLPEMVEALVSGEEASADTTELYSLGLNLLKSMDKPTENQDEGQSDAASADSQIAQEVKGVEESASEYPNVSEIHDDSSDNEDDPLLVELFFSEANQHLSELDNYLRNSLAPADITQTAIRSLHTLKGTAAIAGYMSISTITGALEARLQEIQNNGKRLDEADLSVLADTLNAIGPTIRQHIEPPPLIATKDDLLERIETLGRGETSSPEMITIESTPSEEPVVIREAITEPVDQELVNIFIVEAEELLELLEDVTEKWSSEQHDRPYNQELHRSLHNLKGSARMANAVQVGNVCHGLESLVDAYDEGEIRDKAAVHKLLSSTLASLRDAINQIKVNIFRFDEAPSLLRAINALISGTEVSAGNDAENTDEAISVDNAVTAVIDDETFNITIAQAQSSEVATVETKSAAETGGGKDSSAAESVRINADSLDNLVDHSSEFNVFTSRINQQFGDFKQFLTDLTDLTYRMNDQLGRLEININSPQFFLNNEAGVSSDSMFDPLEFDNFSQIQQLGKSISESVNDLTQLHRSMARFSNETELLLDHQQRSNADFQENLMHLRLVPFSQLKPRLVRILDRTSKELGKKAELKFIGEHNRMDRSVLNKIISPLEHMIRNALDHGIETREERQKKRKTLAGHITITVEREGAYTIIKVSDDGAGINASRIRDKAIKLGLLHPDIKLDDQQLYQYILEAGFTTAEELTQISGRGVGMDVVNSQIKELGGTLSIDSKKGKGTEFTLRLPLTIAISNALLVEVGEEVFALPVTDLEGITRTERSKLTELYLQDTPAYTYNDNQYSLINMANTLELESKQSGSHIPLLMLNLADKRVAFQVDEIRGRQEIVSKPLGRQLGQIKGLSGATILGDGRVALILDPSYLAFTGMTRRAAQTQTVKTAQTSGEDNTKKRKITVMVVDDSVTVRRVSQRLLEKHNMNVVTARDGLDAKQQLEDVIPDIFLLDVEMPRMDGYTFTSFVRGDERYKEIPIIMITSRTGEKHREHALGLGVNEYMGKPYQDNVLLDNITALVSKQQPAEVH